MCAATRDGITNGVASSRLSNAAAVAISTRLRTTIEQVILGKRDVVELAIICLLAEGHLLIDDVPGVGKTELAKALARAVGGRFARIQGTPDLLPTDVTGGHVYDRATGALTFRRGPVFADVVLVDELNRAAPKTQSALLEVMQERRVTVEDRTHDVGQPFVVIATMNPIGFVGTYDLPEAQIDRFMMSLRIGYPDRAAEVQLVAEQHRVLERPGQLPVVEPRELLDMIDIARTTYVSEALVHYMVDIVDATRGHTDIDRGVSPRGTVALAAAVRARALMSGRNHGTADDVRALADPVLAHRLRLSADAALAGRSAHEVLSTILASVPVPTARNHPIVAR